MKVPGAIVDEAGGRAQRSRFERIDALQRADAIALLMKIHRARRSERWRERGGLQHARCICVRHRRGDAAALTAGPGAPPGPVPRASSAAGAVAPALMFARVAGTMSGSDGGSAS